MREAHTYLTPVSVMWNKEGIQRPREGAGGQLEFSRSQLGRAPKPILESQPLTQGRAAAENLPPHEPPCNTSMSSFTIDHSTLSE